MNLAARIERLESTMENTHKRLPAVMLELVPAVLGPDGVMRPGTPTGHLFLPALGGDVDAPAQTG